jgi:hypothetical protein
MVQFAKEEGVMVDEYAPLTEQVGVKFHVNVIHEMRMMHVTEYLMLELVEADRLKL